MLFPEAHLSTAIDKGSIRGPITRCNHNIQLDDFSFTTACGWYIYWLVRYHFNSCTFLWLSLWLSLFVPTVDKIEAKGKLFIVQLYRKLYSNHPLEQL
jgi:hypothetical protein